MKQQLWENILNSGRKLIKEESVGISGVYKEENGNYTLVFYHIKSLEHIKYAAEEAVSNVFGGDTVNVKRVRIGKQDGYKVGFPDYYANSRKSNLETRKKLAEFPLEVFKILKTKYKYEIDEE